MRCQEWSPPPGTQPHSQHPREERPADAPGHKDLNSSEQLKASSKRGFNGAFRMLRSGASEPEELRCTRSWGGSGIQGVRQQPGHRETGIATPAQPSPAKGVTSLLCASVFPAVQWGS